MTDEELVKRLREGATWDDDVAAADRIEALTEQLEAARADAKEAEAYAEELEKGHKGWQTAAVKLMDKLTASEAKLEKVVEAADGMLDEFCIHETQRQSAAYDNMCATLAEIEGEK